MMEIFAAVPGAVVDDTGLRHVGNPLAEQRALAEGRAVAPLGDRRVLAVPGEDQQFCAPARHRDHPAVSEGGDRPSLGERALLGERIADMPQPGVVDDRAGYRREDLAHHSAFASRADACEPRSAPSAAISHAHSRCWSTRPYILVAAP